MTFFSFHSQIQVVDHTEPTYLTVLVDSQQVSNKTLATVLLQSFGGRVSDCQYPPEVNLCFGATDSLAENHCDDPVFAAGDQYSTFILPTHGPQHYSARGNTTMQLTLAAPGAQMESQTIIQAWTHVRPLLPVASAPGLPPPPAPPVPGPARVSQRDYLLAQVGGRRGERVSAA